MSSNNALPKPWSPKRQLIWWIIAISLGVHVLIYLLGSTLLANWQRENLPLHTLLESVGSAIALLVAYKLITLRQHNLGPKYAVRIAQALIVMGLLDGFHAASHIGNNFVWLHSLATFLGGLLFAFIALPDKSSNAVKQTLGIVLLTCVLGILSFAFPDIAPAMVAEGSFTTAANMLNLLGGIFLLCAAVRLIIEYYLSNSVDDLLFSMHCMLFGLAALMFQSSSLWDASWWGWHVLRLAAYIAALVFVILAETKLLHQFGAYGSKMTQLAYTDPLTGVSNRRYFDEQLHKEFMRAKRYGTPLSIVLLDIDYFKQLNDAHGHQNGDKVLIAVAKTISSHLRTNDFIARIGGEEFALIFPSTSKTDIEHLVERIREELSTLVIRSNDGATLSTTASFGIAELTAQTLSEKQLINMADQALYAAKGGGRNQTVVFSEVLRA